MLCLKLALCDHQPVDDQQIFFRKSIYTLTCLVNIFNILNTRQSGFFKWHVLLTLNFENSWIIFKKNANFETIHQRRVFKNSTLDYWNEVGIWYYVGAGRAPIFKFRTFSPRISATFSNLLISQISFNIQHLIILILCKF